MATYARLKNADAIEVTDIRHTTASTPFGASEGMNLGNNKNISARNAANSANVNIGKLNTSDQFELALNPYLPGNPTAALQTATKQYADLFLEAYQEQELSGLIGPISTAGGIVTGSTVSITIVAGQRIELHAIITVSNDTAGVGHNFYVEQNAVDLTPVSRWRSAAANTSGNETSVTFHKMLNPGAGTHTYKLKWANSSGNMYSARSYLSVRAFKFS